MHIILVFQLTTDYMNDSTILFLLICKCFTLKMHLHWGCLFKNTFDNLDNARCSSMYTFDEPSMNLMILSFIIICNMYILV